MSVDINRLGAYAQRQIAQQLSKKKPVNVSVKLKDEFGSGLEQRYYNDYIFPLIIAGKITDVELHKTFSLLPADKYCGISLHKAEYTPDFFITYTDGTVEVVEVKHKKIRRLQGSYVYRRRLFIEKYAKPNGWRFTEWVVD